MACARAVIIFNRKRKQEMSKLKNALASAILVGAMAAPALAEDFGAAGCVVKDGDYIVAGINKMVPGVGGMTLDMLKEQFSLSHLGQMHGALHLFVGRKDPDFNGTSKEWAVMKAEDESGVKLKVVGDKPLWTDKIKGWGKGFDGKDAVVYQCAFESDKAAAAAKKRTAWDVDETPFGVQYVDPRTMKDPAGKDVNIKWRYPEDRTRIIEKLYKPK